MQTIIQGECSDRDPGALDIAADAHSQLLGARDKVAELTRRKAEADERLKKAVALNDGKSDLNELARRVHVIARDLSEAEEELNEAEALSAAWAAEQRRVRFAAISTELRTARQEFAEHYREAALALGRYYVLGAETLRLANALADRPGDGSVYYNPDVNNVLAEAGQDPNPLPALKESGFGEMQTAQSWRRHFLIVPLTKGN